MTPENKPREFTITFETNDGWHGFLSAEPIIGSVYDAVKYNEELKVIEYSAYQTLLEQNRILREGLEFECGNRCAHQNPCNAREALAKADEVGK